MPFMSSSVLEKVQHPVIVTKIPDITEEIIKS